MEERCAIQNREYGNTRTWSFLVHLWYDILPFQWQVEFCAFFFFFLKFRLDIRNVCSIVIVIKPFHSITLLGSIERDLWHETGERDKTIHVFILVSEIPYKKIRVNKKLSATFSLSVKRTLLWFWYLNTFKESFWSVKRLLWSCHNLIKVLYWWKQTSFIGSSEIMSQDLRDKISHQVKHFHISVTNLNNGYHKFLNSYAFSLKVSCCIYLLIYLCSFS